MNNKSNLNNKNLNLTCLLWNNSCKIWFQVKFLVSDFNIVVKWLVGYKLYIFGACTLNHWHFLWDMNIKKWCIGFYIEFRQNFTKETFSYEEYFKS